MHQEVAKSCKICISKPLDDKQGPLVGNMLSTVGLELATVIDPQLSWKTASKGKPRARRRARASFTGGCKKQPTERRSKDNETFATKDVKDGEMPVSESEKLGVTILGRRFSDTFENVPIKKRRFLLVRSPSPPPRLPSPISNETDNNFAKGQISESKIRDSAGMDQDIVVAHEKNNLEKITEKHFDSADFSVLSLLATTACNTSAGDGGTNVDREDFVGMSRSTSLQAVADDKTEEKPIGTLEIFDSKTGLSLERSNITISSAKEPDENKVEVSCFPKCTSSLDVSESMSGALGRFLSSSRDDRFPWDLNTVMDVCESPCDISHPPAVTKFTFHDNRDNEMQNLGPSKLQMEIGEAKYEEERKDGITDSDNLLLDSCGQINLEVELNPDLQCSTSAEDHKNEVNCVPAHSTEDLAQEELQLIHVPGRSEDFSEGIKSFSSQEQCSQGTEALSSLVGNALDPALGSISDDHISDENKGDTHCSNIGSDVEIVNTSSHLAFTDNSGNGHASLSCTTGPAMDLGVSGSAISEIKNAETMKDFDGQLCGRHLDNVQRDDICCVKGPQGDRSPIKINSCLASVPVTEEVCDALSDLNNSKKLTMVDAEGCVEVRKFEAFGEASSNFKCQLKEADKSSLPSDSPAFHTCLVIDGTMGYGDMPLGETKGQGNKCSVLVTENLNAGDDIDSNDSSHDVVHNTPDIVDCVKNTVEVALEDLFDCDYESDASQVDNDGANGVEKVELHGDDDSQYEDGEFRESALHSWEADGGEEGETEYVDYGSDIRDADVFEAAHLCPTSTISSHADSKNEKQLLDSHVRYGVDQVVENDVQLAVCLPDQQLSSLTNTSLIETGKKKAVSVGKMVPRGDYKGKDDTETCAGGDAQCHSTSFRMKCSGWDQLPEGSKSAEGLPTVVESAKRIHSGACSDAIFSGESLRRVGDSTLKRDPSSRLERLKTSNFSTKQNTSYIRGSRSDDPTESKLNIEGDAGHYKSIGRVGSSHLHGRGRSGDHWIESRNSWGGRSRHGSPGFYGSSSFSHPCSKNAAAAAAAKVESNGFVVAPDGTVVEAGVLRSTSSASLRSSNASFQRSHRSLVRRGSPSERDEDLEYDKRLGLGPLRAISPGRGIIVGRGRPGRYAPRMISTGHRERCRDPIPDISNGSSIPMHHMLSRRDRSFSPHRRPFPLSPSRSKSPSRSRTRSPHMWASPRGRSDSGMNDDPGLRHRRKTAPNFRSEGRVERLRSPHRRSGFADRMAGFTPSRNHTSPPHASRWIDERKDLLDHYREHEYKRPSGRSPPARLFSRNQRCDFMESQGRMKSDEYYQSLRSGRFQEYLSIGRGPRSDGGDDGRREHGEVYEMLPSVRQCGFVGDTKRFRYDIEDGFRTHDSRSKNAPDFHERGSLRGFDRGNDKQIGNSPRREEKGPFRYGREGKMNASFKSFVIRECHEDLAARRRRPS